MKALVNLSAIFIFLMLPAALFAAKSLDDIANENSSQQHSEGIDLSSAEHYNFAEESDPSNAEDYNFTEGNQLPVAKHYYFAEEIIEFSLPPFTSKTISESNLMEADSKALQFYEEAGSAEKQKNILSLPQDAIKAWVKLSKITGKNPFLAIAEERLK